MWPISTEYKNQRQFHVEIDYTIWEIFAAVLKTSSRLLTKLASLSRSLAQWGQTFDEIKFLVIMMENASNTL